MKPGVELLAGIPSVVYGFFGLMIIVPFIRLNAPGNGLSLLAASILLGIMILPTVITVAKNALDAVPQSYYEGALALGATHERSVLRVLVPAAISGIMAGVVLGIGRADRRDHGGSDGGGQSADHPCIGLRWRAYHDREHRARDGLCS